MWRNRFQRLQEKARLEGFSSLLSTGQRDLTEYEEALMWEQNERLIARRNEVKDETPESEKAMMTLAEQDKREMEAFYKDQDEAACFIKQWRGHHDDWIKDE